MELFAVIILVIILLTLTHLINWLWRETWDDDEVSGAISFLITIGYLALVLISIKYIIIWGQALIK